MEPYKKRRPLTSDLELRTEYKKNLVRTYNELLIYLNDKLKNATLEERLDIVKKLCSYLSKFKESFQILGLSYPFDKSNNALIDINKISTDTDNGSEEEDDSQDESQDDLPDNNTDLRDLSDQSISVEKTSNTTSDSNQAENDNKMPQLAKDFIALAHQMISY